MSEIQVTTQCQNTENYFTILFEERGQMWLGTEAWKQERTQYEESSEGEVTTVQGQIGTGSSYPGCPYCGNVTIFQCYGCNNLYCYDGHSATAYCVTCDSQITIDGDIEEMEGADNSNRRSGIQEQSTGITRKE